MNGKIFTEASLDSIEKTFGVNVFGSIYFTKEFVQTFIESKKGHILFVSSVMGMTGAAYSTDYAASKFAITGFSESLRQELKGR